MAVTPTPKFFPLGYYFFRVVDFPTDHSALEFPTALRLFDPHEDSPTKITPTEMRGLAPELEAYDVTTFTEYDLGADSGDKGCLRCGMSWWHTREPPPWEPSFEPKRTS